MGRVTEFEPDQAVRHMDHGEGRVVVDLGATVVVRFGAKLHQVEATELERLRSLADSLATGSIDDSLAVLTRAQAMAIRSINDQWGVFSRSRVTLLPHQLWVCRQVTRTWPIRWLVADDVGLGKTIEAGLILESLLASGRVRRVLVLAPARLVPQWRARLKTMFDIRLQEYAVEIDRGSLSFWETANQVVASFHTLRQEKLRERLLSVEPWDLVMVDEAHHFQAGEDSVTLTYELLRCLEGAGKILSMVLFTGTPHRGKDYAFLALMQLVRPDLFDPQRDIRDQLGNLHNAMIRNNKALVTDLDGRRLFQPIHNVHVEYSYSLEEAEFYAKMSRFIIDGRAYALSLTGREQSARMLLLIALQKLAASSIAAIKQALVRRRDLLVRAFVSALPLEEEEADTLDEAAEAEEERPSQFLLLIVRDEISRLNELIDLAAGIRLESKVKCLLDLIEKRIDPNEPLLMFTEYKATQALVYEALEARFGEGVVGFINGDERLALPSSGAAPRLVNLSREVAAADFNVGWTRFLVSTEAGGEGIDLQERCATLIHVDFPWNPMRLHQRVGRLHRYGQKRAVSVFLLRNPDTVEARIWDLMQQKLARIQTALSASMEEADDITQLVIGVLGNRYLDDIFVQGGAQRAERLSEWFNAHTRELGGRDAVETVRALLGNVARYDFQSAGPQIPKLDIPALESFFRQAMQLQGRRVTRSQTGLSVATPEAWRASPDLKPRYDGLVFDRMLPADRALMQLLGVGHPLIDRSILECSGQDVYISRVCGLLQPLLVGFVEDEVTGTGCTVHRVVLGIEGTSNSVPRLLKDWELLLRVNELRPSVDKSPLAPAECSVLVALIEVLQRINPDFGLPFRHPRVRAALAIVPETHTQASRTL